MSGRKQWNKQAATSSFLDKKPPESLILQGLEGSTTLGKDEVGSSNLPSSSKMNEARFSNIFIEKRASTCPQSLEKSRLFSYALLVSECENFQNMKRIFLRKVVI
jgi:hypothetical protein